MRTVASLVAVLLLIPSGAALAAPTAPPPQGAAPDDALEAPRFLGLEVVGFRRGVNRFGQPISTSEVAGTFDAVWARLRGLFVTETAFAPGWTIRGAGGSTKTRTLSVTVQGPEGRRYTLRGRELAASRMELTLTGKPHLFHSARMAEPAPDRKP